ALSQCRSIRTASVLRPRNTSHASNGPATAPIAFWWYASRSARSSSWTTSAPPTTSEWPPQYLVVEWTTTSAPSASGCCRYGVANVLSTTSSAPASRAIAPNAAMSAMFSSGLVGVSTQMTRVSCRTAARTAATSVTGAAVHDTSHRSSTPATRRYVPPYASSGSTRWSPGRSSARSRVSSAAMPLANANARVPSSSAARHSSSALRVGLAVRLYSYPARRTPTPSWAYVLVA